MMVSEVASELITDPGGIYLDATIGGGGHAELILRHLHTSGRVIGLDRDRDALREAWGRLAHFGPRVTLRHADYRDLAAVFHALGIEAISGALFDLGLSSLQLDDPSRGFAYRFDGPLDLRFDQSHGATAAAWLATATVDEIADVLRRFGEERHALRLARAIVRTRAQKGQPLATTADLTRVITAVVGSRGSDFGRTAARVFQALRIATNDELTAIPIGLQSALDRLVPGARLVVIAYHSLEDRLVKSHFREWSRLCRCPAVWGRCMCGAHPVGRLVHRRALRPTAGEIARNPRAKAARMRVLERLPDQLDMRPSD
ncbi:MAG: 16S rRNA (cytosine(1402)-N(4))-methyltransferase RsmH [Candidatus Zixiibacteriota bacterium]